MKNISFGSTYRVNFSQPKQGVSPHKKDELKKLAKTHNHCSVPSGRTGNVKFSVKKKLDEQVEATLKKLGFKEYEKVEIHNVWPDEINDVFAKTGRFEFLKLEE